MSATTSRASSGYPVPGTALQEQYDSAGECAENDERVETLACNRKMEQTGTSCPKQQKSEKRDNKYERNERSLKRRNHLFSIGQEATGFNYSKDDSVYI